MKKIGVSQATIRRDLIELENLGFLKKVHGGCIIKEMGEEEEIVNYSEDLDKFKEKKNRIAKEAVNRINNGENESCSKVC